LNLYLPAICDNPHGNRSTLNAAPLANIFAGDQVR
jgi:hypothetical protein